MLVLPFPFGESCSMRVRGIGGVAKSGGGIYRSGDGVPGNVRGRYGLACGTGGRTGRMMLLDPTRCRMGSK